MISFKDASEMANHAIGQSDDNDYSESGYIVVIKDGIAAISAYSHCSCYDTWDDLQTETGLMRWDWTGSVDELRAMLSGKIDPNHPGRAADPSDYDYDHLCEAYAQAEKWLAANLPWESNPKADVAPASGAHVQRVVGCELSNGETK